MNTKNGKCGVFAALTAALLVTAALITSCPAPEEVIVYRDGYQPPPGMGYIKINAPEFTGERTALPSAGVWVQYDLVIQKYTTLSTTPAVTAGDPITITGVLAADLATTRINLAPGFYTVEVTAYTAAGATGKAAKGTSDRYSVQAGQGTTIPVMLKPLPYTETGDGYFAYTIKIEEDIIVDTLEITIGTGGSPVDATSAISPLTDTATLTPGSYLVLLEATVGSETASIIEAVNIHQNLTSSATFTFDGKQFLAYIAPITVDYDPVEIKPILTKTAAPIEVDENTTITLALDLAHSGATPGTETITITNVSEAGYTSTAWYCGSLTPIGNGASLTITAGVTAPFTQQRAYPVTVVGVAGGRSYSQMFTVVIGN
jgi:hypothetical protein